ncbi:myb-like protein M [Chelonus insularis]|uniref:myb-like protein M n=1 Tax=Chelonus insularis TaxID=460826 RepID=UPI001588E380|nr:myb-like protein M [Chelonus insularis]
MEEFDDNHDVLEDIKALEIVLTQDNTYNEIHKSNDLAESNYSTVEFTEFTLASSSKHSLLLKPFHDQSQKSVNIISDIYKSNTSLINSFKLAIGMVSMKLEECIKRQKEVDYQIQAISKRGKANWKVNYIHAGMPYFKDEKFFPSPMNEDTKQKQLNNELSIVHLRGPTRWTTKDRNLVKIAVRAQAANEAFDKMIKKTKENINYNNEDNECIPPKDLLAMVGPLGSKEFDWMKISAIDLKGRHTPNECRAIWNILLHPEINSSKWSRDEDTMLKIQAKFHNCLDWDRISKELYSNRSAYVSFIRYNTLFGTAYTDVPWTAPENNFLTTCIEEQKFGDLIPWSCISIYLNDRTKNQIYSHWKYNLDPSLKKGRFNSDEDQLLLDSVSEFGTNFPKISAEVMPYRTSVQLSGRFRLLMLKTNKLYNSWTISDDRKLLQLYEEFGAQWSMIANIMKRDRTYIRHRYTAIKRHMCKGTKLTSIPRKYCESKCNDEHNDDWNVKIINEQELNTSIDIQLIKYFQSIQAAKAKPGRKSTYHTADQLETYTKKLYNIFEKLNTKIIIPDNINSFNISTKDKELLISFKKYCIEKLTLSSKIIEQYRQKMFGDINLNDESEHFIPPAPFGLFQNRVSRSSSNNTKTNLISNTCHVDLTMDFQTPDNVVKFLTAEEIIHFNKLQSFIGTKFHLYSKSFDKIHFQPVENLKKTNNTRLDPFNQEAEVSIDYPDDDNNREKNVFIEPCHSTLIGYQSLLIIKNLLLSETNIKNDDLTFNRTKLTNKGREAFTLLKLRLQRLFKYPVIIARLSPNNYIEKISHHSDINNIFNYVHDETLSYSNEPVMENNSKKNNYVTLNNEEKLPDTEYEIEYNPTSKFSSEKFFHDNIPLVTNNLSNCEKLHLVSVNFENTKQEQEN